MEYILINVEKITEDGDSYYLATSSDIPGLLVEASSKEQLLTLVPEVVNDLFQVKKDRLRKAALALNV